MIWQVPQNYSYYLLYKIATVPLKFVQVGTFVNCRKFCSMKLQMIAIFLISNHVQYITSVPLVSL